MWVTGASFWENCRVSLATVYLGCAFTIEWLDFLTHSDPQPLSRHPFLKPFSSLLGAALSIFLALSFEAPKILILTKSSICYAFLHLL